MAQLEQLDQRLRPELLQLDPGCGPARDEILNQWRERLTRRYESMQAQLEQPDPPMPIDPQEDAELLELAVGQEIDIEDLYPRQETPDAELTTGDMNGLFYRIDVGESRDCVASWRRAVVYRLECIALPWSCAGSLLRLAWVMSAESERASEFLAADVSRGWLIHLIGKQPLTNLRWKRRKAMRGWSWLVNFAPQPAGAKCARRSCYECDEAI